MHSKEGWGGGGGGGGGRDALIKGIGKRVLAVAGGREKTTSGKLAKEKTWVIKRQDWTRKPEEI